MTRNARQNKILELIRQNEIEKQEELVAMLIDAGFSVTQATVSRDIKELNVVKTSVGGKQRYVREESGNSVSSKLTDMLRHAVISIDHASNVAVFKTLSGSANVVALLIDKNKEFDVLGTIAGDDTTISVCRTEEDAIGICEQIRALVED